MKLAIYLAVLGMSFPVAAQDINSMGPGDLAVKALTEGTGFLDPSEILAWVDLPRSVKKGEKIALRITVENARVQGNFELDSVDIDSSFLNGFRIESVSPIPSDTDESFGSLTLEYPMTISAGATVNFDIDLVAIKEGVYIGEVSIWNGDMDFLSRYVQCKVIE